MNWKSISGSKLDREIRLCLAVPGLYFYDSKVVAFAKRLAPPAAGPAGNHAVEGNLWWLPRVRNTRLSLLSRRRMSAKITGRVTDAGTNRAAASSADRRS